MTTLLTLNESDENENDGNDHDIDDEHYHDGVNDDDNDDDDNDDVLLRMVLIMCLWWCDSDGIRKLV